MSKPKVLIEIRDGGIVYTVATEAMDICIVDHDFDVTSVETLEPDKILTSPQMSKYIRKVSKEPGNQ